MENKYHIIMLSEASLWSSDIAIGVTVFTTVT